MEERRTQRRLAAILAADVVGYSKLIRADEEGTLARLKALRSELIDPKIAQHEGRIVKLMGDGILLEFASVVDAVRTAVEVQQAMADRNANLPEPKRIAFRVGVNLGDVVIDGDDIHGDGVNVAARLEGLSEPGGICISDNVYDQVRDRTDFAFEDLGKQKVKNIERPIRVWHWQLTDEDTITEPATAEEPLPLQDRPSIAVLPFDNMSADPEQDYFADGIAEEIITTLSKLPWFHTIARNSSFMYKGRSVDVQQLGRELGAGYVLEGSVRKAGARIRISVQLIEAESRSHLWAERFDGEFEDIFDLQDRISARVVGAIAPSVQVAEIARARSLRSENLTAYDNYLRALPHYRMHTLEGFEQALKFLSKARDLDSDFALATALAANCIFRPIGGGWISWSDARVDEAANLARLALAGGHNDPLIMVHAASVLAFGNREHETALTLANNALRTAPYHAEVLERAGWIEIWCGELDQAIEHLMRARQMNPNDLGMHDVLNGLAAAHLFAKRNEDAVNWARKAHAQKPDFAVALRYLAASQANLNRLDEARDTIMQLLSIQPHCTVSLIKRLASRMSKHPSMIAPFLDGLQRAGLPEK